MKEQRVHPAPCLAPPAVAYPVPPSTLLTSLLLQPLHPPPSKHYSHTPTYRFCIPQSWLLKPTPTSSAISSALTSRDDDHDDGEEEEEEASTTLKASHSTTSHASLSLEPSSNPPAFSSSPRAPATTSKPATARHSIFDSIYSTFSSSSSPTTTTATAAASSPPARKAQTDNRLNRNSVVVEAISEPMPASNGIGRGVGLGLEGGLGPSEEDERVGGAAAGVEGEVEIEEAEFDALMVRSFLFASAPVFESKSKADLLDASRFSPSSLLLRLTLTSSLHASLSSLRTT